ALPARSLNSLQHNVSVFGRDEIDDARANANRANLQFAEPGGHCDRRNRGTYSIAELRPVIYRLRLPLPLRVPRQLNRISDPSARANSCTTQMIVYSRTEIKGYDLQAIGPRKSQPQ